MSLQRGANIRGWEGVTRNMTTNSEERSAWRFSLFSMVLTLIVTGMAAQILAQTDIPTFAKALLGILVLLFTVVLISGIYSLLVRRASGSTGPASVAEETIGQDSNEDLYATIPTGMVARVAQQNRLIPSPAARIAKTSDAAPEIPQTAAPEAVAPDVQAAPEASHQQGTISGPAAASDDTSSTGMQTSENPARPQGLDGPRDGKPDDLKRIKGVGPKLEELCNSLGFWHFDQIAAWTQDEIDWVDSNLEGFSGRVTRDDWVNQARELAGS